MKDDWKFYINPYQSDLEHGILTWQIDFMDDKRPISNEWKLVGHGPLEEINDFIDNENMDCVSGKFTFRGIKQRWNRFPYRFTDDRNRLSQLKEGDVLRHRNKNVVALLKGDTWGYINHGTFVPFVGEHKHSIVFSNGEYWDLDFAQRIGNVFDNIISI